MTLAMVTVGGKDVQICHLWEASVLGATGTWSLEDLYGIHPIFYEEIHMAPWGPQDQLWITRYTDSLLLLPPNLVHVLWCQSSCVTLSRPRPLWALHVSGDSGCGF